MPRTSSTGTSVTADCLPTRWNSVAAATSAIPRQYRKYEAVVFEYGREEIDVHAPPRAARDRRKEDKDHVDRKVDGRQHAQPADRRAQVHGRKAQYGECRGGGKIEGIEFEDDGERHQGRHCPAPCRINLAALRLDGETRTVAGEQADEACRQHQRGKRP